MKKKDPLASIVLMTDKELLQVLDICRELAEGKSPLVKITAMERKFK